MIELVVRAVIPQKQQYLLVRNKPSGVWCLPGGKVKPNEAIEQALERELVEELGVRPLIGQLLYVYQLHVGEKQRVEFFFLVNNPEPYEAVELSRTSHGRSELHEAGFYRLQDVPLLPRFLAEELPDLLKHHNSGVLPHFRFSQD